MNSNLVEDRKALHKAFLKIKAISELLESFKVKRAPFWNSFSENKFERFSNNRTQDFLKTTFYDPIYSLNINRLNSAMLSSAEILIGVIIDGNSPNNKSVMISADVFNVKALQELVLYYLCGSITQKNTNPQHFFQHNSFKAVYLGKDLVLRCKN